MFKLKFLLGSLLSTGFIGCSVADKNTSSERLQVDGKARLAEGHVLVTTPTRFKVTTADVSGSTLNPNKFCQIAQGSDLIVSVFFGEESSDSYVKVNLKTIPRGCNFDTGYFYREHVSIKRNGDGNSNSSGAEGNGTQVGGGTPNRTLINFYNQEGNYDKVYNNVYNWFAPTNNWSATSNGCVAFASSALRLSQAADVPYEGQGGVSRLTRPFSNYLQNSLGWKKITNPENLQAGDVVFTTDAAGYPGEPAHVYIFSSWAIRARKIAYVIDNQGFKYMRNIGYDSEYQRTPFAYALRSSR